MKRLTLSLIALSTLASSAFADIGDTLASSEAKYGKGQADLPRVVYFHNGWWIRQTFNAEGHCALAEFARLDGKVVTDTQARNLDKNNLPAEALTGRPGEWSTTEWETTDNMNVWSYVWKKGDITCHVLSGWFRYGNDKEWFSARSYITPDGQAIVEQENAKHDAAADTQATKTSDNPDSSI